MIRRARTQLSIPAPLLAVALLGACDKSDAASAPPASSSSRAKASSAALAPAVPLADEASVCTTLCQKTAPLECISETQCLEDCAVSKQALAPCGAVLDAFLTCQLSQPLPNFACQDDGMPMVNEPHCAEQRGPLADCIARLGG